MVAPAEAAVDAGAGEWAETRQHTAVPGTAVQQPWVHGAAEVAEVTVAVAAAAVVVAAAAPEAEAAAGQQERSEPPAAQGVACEQYSSLEEVPKAGCAGGCPQPAVRVT